jgi:surfactin family lipopeptide synthetase B
VTEAAVIIRENKADENEICAYFTAGREVAVPRAAKNTVSVFPDYMIPCPPDQMDSHAADANGKIEQKATACTSIRSRAAEYAAPKTEAEKILRRSGKEFSASSRRYR